MESRKPTVYIETTVVSYLTARRTTDVIRQGQQEITKQWWDNRRPEFALFTSQFVLDEAAAGDAAAAADRLATLVGIDLLSIGPEVPPLASHLLTTGALPMKARLDALHLAVAAVNGLEYLLTWNCRHLANAALRHRIESVCLAEGFEPPTICTPFDLMGADDEAGPDRGTGTPSA